MQLTKNLPGCPKDGRAELNRIFEPARSAHDPTPITVCVHPTQPDSSRDRQTPLYPGFD